MPSSLAKCEYLYGAAFRSLRLLAIETAMIAHMPTALVVETNYLIASAIETPLIESGFHVLVATDDQEARQLLLRHTVGIAIIDFRLQYGGPEGLVEILEAREIPYVFCTAASTEEVVEHFPAAAVIEKPFSDQTLLSFVSGLMAGT